MATFRSLPPPVDLAGFDEETTSITSSTSRMQLAVRRLRSAIRRSDVEQIKEAMAECEREVRARRVLRRTSQC